MTFLLSKSTVGFFSGSSKECASARLDADVCLQTNGFGTAHPEAAVPHVVILLEHRAAAKGSTGKVEKGAPRARKRDGGTLSWQHPLPPQREVI